MDREKKKKEKIEKEIKKFIFKKLKKEWEFGRLFFSIFENDFIRKNKKIIDKLPNGRNYETIVFEVASEFLLNDFNGRNIVIFNNLLCRFAILNIENKEFKNIEHAFDGIAFPLLFTPRFKKDNLIDFFQSCVKTIIQIVNSTDGDDKTKSIIIFKALVPLIKSIKIISLDKKSFKDTLIILGLLNELNPKEPIIKGVFNLFFKDNSYDSQANYDREFKTSILKEFNDVFDFVPSVFVDERRRIILKSNSNREFLFDSVADREKIIHTDILNSESEELKEKIEDKKSFEEKEIDKKKKRDSEEHKRDDF